MGHRLELSNERFGRLIVSEFYGISKTHKTLWKCVCDCGNIKVIYGSDLTQGKTKSCGCLSTEISTINGLLNYTHGMSRSTEYRIWRGMIQRCYDKSSPSYINYGKRGIGVCEEWRRSFESFHKDMGMRPSKEFTLDRINNELGYFKENCKWSTRAHQAINRRGKQSSKSKYKGVTWSKNQKKWRAMIWYQKKLYYLGSYSDENQAAHAYNEKCIYFYGKDTWINKIDSMQTP